MNLIDMLKGKDNSVGERIDYIFSKFQENFPEVKYKERESIIGIGEAGKYLLCYFKKEKDGAIFVKFKSNSQAVPIMIDKEEIDLYVMQTTELFKSKDFSKKKKDSKEKKLGSIDEAVESLFQKLLQQVIPQHGELSFENLVSQRLCNALCRGGILKISDLSEWTIAKIKQIPYFGAVCLQELLSTLESLRGEEHKNPSKLQELHYIATKNQLKELSLSTEAQAYLRSVEYDEQLFEEGTVGYILCLQQKGRKGFSAKFATDEIELEEIYFNSENVLLTILSQTKELLCYFVGQARISDRNKEIIAARLGLREQEKSLRAVGEVYGLSGEGVNQITKKGLKRIARPFNFLKEEDREKYKVFRAYLDGFSACSVDAFILYLKQEKLRLLTDAFERVVLSRLACPNDLEKRLKVAELLVQRRIVAEKADKERIAKQKEPKPSYPLKGVNVIVDEEGEVKTDLELYEQLRVWRLRKAREEGVDAYMIFNNKTLVELATYFPTTQEECLKIQGIGAFKWDKYGEEIIQIIKEYFSVKETKKA